MKKIILILGLIFTFVGAAIAVSVPRWNIMPINVYIENNSKSQIVTNAFNAWQSASGGVVKFRYPTGDIWTKRANIIVRFADKQAENEPGAAAMQVNVGGFFMHGDLSIALNDKEGNPLTDEQIYAGALHVIGHALGVQHSLNSKDIMYKSLTTQKSLTQGDIDAIKNVYTLQKPTFNSTVIMQ